MLLLGGCISELTVRAKPDIIILLYEKDTQRAACETASVLCCQRYGVLCWESARGLDKCAIAFIISYASMERPMDQQQVMRITKALADPTRREIVALLAAAARSRFRFPIDDPPASE